MPKRNNPFGDHSSLQLKTHVGEKEVDKGVCQQTRMQTVYERTQALLFKGMKESAETDMAVDVNDNQLAGGRVDVSGNPGWENSSLRQLHLNKNCELVNSEEDESTDMETDSQAQRLERDLLSVAVPKVPSAFLFNAVTTEHCHASALPTFGLNFGRNSGALSPSDSTAENQCHEVGQSPGRGCKDAFSLLMQSGHLKSGDASSKGFCRACHNCRRPVQARDVIKCQFCEQYICGGCVRQCLGCFMHYCQLCSVVNYDQVSERAFCLTCSGR